jgi:hypothetical protein
MSSARHTGAMRTPAWWRADEPHWAGRTMAIIAALAIAVTAVLAFLGWLVFGGEDEPAAPPEAVATATPTATPTDQGGCSPNAEGEPLVGWGPDRQVYLDNTYPTSLTFNSTYKNENVGDERNWVRVRAIDDPDAMLRDKIEVTGGAEYAIQAYVRLDGPSDQVADDPVVMFNVPVCTGHRIGVSGFVLAGNVFPGEVYDGVEFWALEDFNLFLVPDSAVLYSNDSPDGGMPVSTEDLVTTTGVDPGSDSPDGLLRPGYADDRYIEFRVRAQTASD